MNRQLITICLLWTGLAACSKSSSAPGSTPPPSARPQLLLAAKSTGPATVELTWSGQVGDEAGFKIERASSPFVEIAQVDASTATFIDNTALPNSSYMYRVRPFTTGGDQQYSNEVAVDTPQALSLDDLGPNSGFSVGGTTVSIRGAGFMEYQAGAPTVQFDGAVAQANVIDDAAMDSLSPTSAPGVVDVMVTNNNGTDMLDDAFMYYTWPPKFLDNDVRVNQDLAGSADSVCPQMCVEGSNVYVVWGDFRGGIAQDIYFNRSRDGGVTWMPADRRLDTTRSGTTSSSCPAMHASGQNVYVVWSDYRNGGSDIYFNSSSDGGSTWQMADVRLDTNFPGVASSTEPRIASDGSNVYVVWQDGRNGKRDIYFNGSKDGGKTWLASDVRLDTDLPGKAFSFEPQLSASGQNVHVAWMDTRNGRGDIFFNGSSDGGATWLASDVQLDTDGKGASASVVPRLASRGNDVTVVWQDLRNGREDLYSNSSSDGGMTWLASDVRIDTDAAGMAASKNQRLTYSGGVVVAVWQDGRNTGSDLYANSSSDGGKTWAAQDVRINSGVAGSAFAIDPRICGSHGNVFVVWVDARNGGQKIFFNSSTDGGATWQPLDQRIDADLSGLAEATVPVVASDGARVYSVWSDDRNGLGSDIFFTQNTVQ